MPLKEVVAMDIPAALANPGEHRLTFRCLSGGMTLYGNRMGRYGMNPAVVVRDADR